MQDKQWHSLEGIMSRKNTICYLCGEPGADSRDHVPPKGLLPEFQYGKYQRITVPAHRKCNSATSDDEEYVRDLLIMEAEALHLPKHELITPKVWRSWSREAGFKRYSSIIRTAVPVNLITESGIYVGKALGVRPNIERIKSVGRKMVKGMICYDTGAIIGSCEIPIGLVPSRDLPELRSKDAKDPFWIGLSSDCCLHDICADTVAIRRVYEGIPMEGGHGIVVRFAILLWTLTLLSGVVFPMDAIRRKNFRFAINLTIDAWQRGAS
ncbi:MAG: hypothetical protein DMF68_14560 [Acidobacteria bacterium]|nr:MAG: hypothetical protein DMF68_14560 [Acidobacteriota bacterium]